MRAVETIAIIGCGGVTAHMLTCLIHHHNLILVDGDAFEPKNTVRQFAAHIGSGKNKAETYHGMYSKFTDKTIEFIPNYIAGSTILPDCDLLMVAVDNNDARLAAKEIAMRMDIPLIWGANEEEDPQAMLFLPEYEGTNWDPFVRYKLTADGMGPGASCTTVEAVESAPQLPIANNQASAFMLMILNAVLKVGKDENLPAEVLGTRNSIHSCCFKQLSKEVAVEHSVAEAISLS